MPTHVRMAFIKKILSIIINLETYESRLIDSKNRSLKKIQLSVQSLPEDFGNQILLIFIIVILKMKKKNQNIYICHL